MKKIIQYKDAIINCEYIVSQSQDCINGLHYKGYSTASEYRITYYLCNNNNQKIIVYFTSEEERDNAFKLIQDFLINDEAVLKFDYNTTDGYNNIVQANLRAKRERDAKLGGYLLSKKS